MLNVLPHDTGGRRAPHEARAFPSRVVQPVYVGRGVHGVFELVQSDDVKIGPWRFQL